MKYMTRRSRENNSTKNGRTFRPRLERLESRAHPGSFLTGGLELWALAPVADPTVWGPGDTSAADLWAAPELDHTPQGVVLNAGGHDDAANEAQESGAVAASVADGLPLRAAGPSRGIGDAGSDHPLSLTAENLIPTIAGSAALGRANRSAEAPSAAPSPASAEGMAHRSVSTAPVAMTSLASGATMAVAPPRAASATAATPDGVHLENIAHVHTTAVQVGRGGQPSASLSWLSYLGAADAGQLHREILAGDSTLVAVGSAQDPADPTTVDIVVAKVTLDGSQASLLYINPGDASGTTSSGNGVAIDAQGVVYVVGTTDVNGSPNMVAARVASDFSSTDWVVTLDDPGAVDAATGATLNAAGSALYLVGSLDHSAGGGNAQDTAAARFTNLDQPTPTLDAMHSFIFSSGVSSATDVTIDGFGRLDLAGTLQYAPAGIGPAVFQVNAALTQATGLFYSFTGTDNAMRAIAFGQDGNIYATGRVQSTRGYDLLMVKFNSSLTSQIWGWQPQSSNGAAWGEGIQADAAGFPYITGSDGGSVLVVKFTQDGFTIVDGIDIVGDANNDVGGGIALDASNNVYVVGTATSDDLATPGVFQETYGGGASDGLIAQVQNLV